MRAYQIRPSQHLLRGFCYASAITASIILASVPNPAITASVILASVPNRLQRGWFERRVAH